VLLLLDTHAFLWWNADDPALGPNARTAIADSGNIVFVSAATAWEIATKRESGKLDAPGDIVDWIRQGGFTELAIELEHARAECRAPEASSGSVRSAARRSSSDRRTDHS